MDTKALQRLVDQARKDPKFFHALVFDPESVLKEVNYLDRNDKAVLIGINPGDVIGSIVGADGGCTGTCGSASCDGTCGSKSCDNTCSSSCGDTCSSSCRKTTELGDVNIIVDPAWMSVLGYLASRMIAGQAAGGGRVAGQG